MGIIRLYAAVLVSNVRREQTGVNPHGLDNGWIWLTNILKLGKINKIIFLSKLLTHLLYLIRTFTRDMRHTHIRIYCYRRIGHVASLWTTIPQTSNHHPYPIYAQT